MHNFVLYNQGDSTDKKMKQKNKHECQNLKCSQWNKEIGTWRTDKGQKGGGKGWCSNCLKTEEREKQGLFKDEHGNLKFIC